MPLLLVGSGLDADVFDLEDGTVLKAFRRKQHTDILVDNWPAHDALVRAFFLNEAAAYERLQRQHDLRCYAPEYHGILDPVEALPLAKDAYVGGCGLRLEKLPGSANKLWQLSVEMRLLVERILREIHDRIEPGNVWDCSCFVPGTESPSQ